MQRKSWGLECPTVLIPRTGGDDDKPAQMINDLIVNAAVWRNGGCAEDTHLCDDCLRVGLRHIKLKVDACLEVIEADTDKDAVPDYLDKCANSPAGIPVDATGCPFDADKDGFLTNQESGEPMPLLNNRVERAENER